MSHHNLVNSLKERLQVYFNNLNILLILVTTCNFYLLDFVVVYLLLLIHLDVYLSYSDITKIQTGIGDKIGSLQQAIAMLLAGFVIGFTYSWKMTLVIIAMSPIMGVSAYISGKV